MDMILFKKDWGRFPTAIVDLNTKNQSALKLAGIYKLMGIENHLFFLALINPNLQGINPHAEDLSLELKAAISLECKINPWYFFREVAMVPVEGTHIGKPFELNRANISLIWSFFNHIRFFLIQPRQTGKSVSSDVLSSYLLTLGTINTKINLLTKSNDLRIKNIIRLKGCLDLLPDYIDIRDTRTDANNTETITVNRVGNRYDTHVPQKSEKDANGVGRGLTTPIFLIDEAPFQPNIATMIGAAMPGLGAAIEDARLNGTHHGVIFTTTAGSKDDPSGAFIYNEIQKSCVWDELLLDSRDMESLYRTIKTARGTLSLNGTFNYKQLGKTDEWMRDKLANAMQSEDASDRDYFNVWRSGTEQHPLSVKQRNTIVQSQLSPLYTEINKENNYIIRWYVNEYLIKQKLSKGKFILSIDPSDGGGGDDIGVLLTEVSTGETIASATINETNIITFSEWVKDILVAYDNIILMIERRSSGPAILDNLLIMLPNLGIDPFKRIFNKIVNNYDEEKIAYKEINRNMGQRSRDVYTKYKQSFGFATSGSGMFSRTNLYDGVLRNAANLVGGYVRDKVLIDQINTLVKIKGRVDHTADNHDDLVIAWLMTNWLLTTGKNLSFYGISADEILRVPRNIATTTDDPIAKLERYKQQKYKEEITKITELISEETDPYLVSSLEKRLEIACTKLNISSEEKISVEQLLAEANEKRKDIINRSKRNSGIKQNRFSTNIFEYL